MAAKKIYVGNLPFRATEETVKSFFAPYGEVHSVNIITDRETGRARGFCFVEMENADSAIAELNGKEMEGRALRINEARDRAAGDNNRGGGDRGDRGGNSRKNSW